MITHVSPGSYNSISLEILFKFLLSLTPQERHSYYLYGSISQFKIEAKKIGLFFDQDSQKNIFSLQSQQINFTPIKSSPYHLIDILDYILNLHDNSNKLLNSASQTQKRSFLLTMPAQKSDLNNKAQTFLGHTEYFRAKWQNNLLPMLFWGPQYYLLLLTDHIPLEIITSFLTVENILTKCRLTLLELDRLGLNSFEHIVFLGINPHAGENGLLGKEENVFETVIYNLKKEFPQYEYHGPIAGDNLNGINLNSIKKNKLKKHSSNSANYLIVSPFHDQGLSHFKSTSGFLGVNITLGGPLLRISPDHGTSPSLAFKRKAIYTSLLWCHKFLQLVQ